jgi:hypothetical protein
LEGLSLENPFSAGLEQVWRDKPAFQPELDFCNILKTGNFVQKQARTINLDGHVHYAAVNRKSPRMYAPKMF